MNEDMSSETQKSRAGTTMDPTRGPSAAEMRWLTSYADVVDVFRSKDFVQGGGGRRDSAPMVGDSLLSLSGVDHYERRRIDSSLFRKLALRHLELEVLAPALAANLEDIRRSRDSRGVAHGDLVSLLRRTFTAVSAAFWGIDGVDNPERVDTYVQYLKMMGPAADVEWESRDHDQILQEGLRFKALFAREFFRPSWERREKLVAEHTGNGTEDQLPDDLITVMLRHRTHFVKWDPDVFLREVIVFDPGASIVRVVPRIIDDLTRWFEGHPEDKGLVDDVPFLRRASNESLRLRPVVPYFIRKAERDTDLASGQAFRAGEYVAIDIATASRDSSVFGLDAEEFNPHRVPLVKVKPTGIAFGDGPHTCIGMAMSVGEPSTMGEDPKTPIGFVVYVVRELFRVGVGADPDQPPRWNDANVRSEYAEYPVRFNRL